jgi:PAS domain S-box-containing protein
MLSEDIDFYQIFKIHPTAMALLTPDLEFIDANDEFLAATGHQLEELLGKNAFALFPKMPSEPEGSDLRWTALEEAQSSGHRTGLSLTRYDIEDPASPGIFHEHYWSTTVTPVRGANGRVEALEFSAREVTPVVEEFKKLEDVGQG